MKQNIVVSAVNFYKGGTFTVFKECLGFLSRELADQYNIIALVGDKSLFEFKNITYYEFPLARRSWLYRLYYEYIYFRGFSKKLKPYLWLSMHDMTPNVQTERLVVYCHNPAPFYKLSFIDCLMDYRFALFTKLYKYAYRINIRKNDFVVVQQNWIRDRFRSMFGLDNVIVSLPDVKVPRVFSVEGQSGLSKNTSFFYPAFPRCFKNIEVICEAAKQLIEQGMNDFEVFLTINGKENRYSKSLFNKYKSIAAIKFMGILSREQVYEYYSKAHCLIFPSKLETWGLPITEFKVFGKPILMAEFPYAHETIGVYDKARFFHSDDPRQLAGLMRGVIENKITYDKICQRKIAAPFASNWQELFNFLLAKKTLTCI